MIWIDVEDLFAYAGAFRRPSGIQRAVFELCRALAATDGRRIGFLRHAGRDDFTETSWPEIAALFAGFSRPAPSSPPAAQGIRRALSLQREVFAALAELPRALLPPKRPAVPPAGFTKGDVLLVAGAGWDDPTHTHRLLSAKRRFGLRLAVLVYDLIPLRRPEWCDRQTAARFRRWIEALLEEADHLLAISAATAGDVASHRATLGLPPMPATVIRLGDGFSDETPAVPQDIPHPYALFVSTLEIRKNHALLLEAWRILLDRHGPDRVPHLVFAGREGPLVGDTLRVLRASRFLDGHVIWRRDATDADLAALYRGCRFTLFPSLYEGWGLPVAESLCFGKPCLAAGTTSLPEVGGALVRYLDPLDLSDTVAAIEAVITDQTVLPAWEARIHAEFRPTPWSATAATTLAGLPEGG